MPERNATSMVVLMKGQTDWKLFFQEAQRGIQFFVRRNKTFRFRFIGPEFLCGKPYAKCKSLSGTRKNPVHLEVDRTLFLMEALSKTQISGANTRLALIIFKRSNGNWIFLRWLARASLSRDCFNSLLAPCSNIVPGPRGLTGHRDALQIINVFYNRCCSHPSVAPPNQKINSNTSN